MFNLFVYNNLTFISIVIFLFLFSILIITKPIFVFDKNGKPRNFGLGYRNKTVIPIWLISIILAILSYFSITVYIKCNKIII